MNNYIDSIYYYETYNGNLIPQEEFKKIATKASNVVRTRILNKDISNYKNLIQDVTCQVADLLFSQNEIEEKIKSYATGIEKIITSEKVGDYSRNISSVPLTDLKKISLETKEKINQVIEENLFFTGLLYGGIHDVR